MLWGIVKYRETRKVLYGYILQGIRYTAVHQDIEVRRAPTAPLKLFALSVVSPLKYLVTLRGLRARLC
jgi:hypothetical protein